MKKNNVIAILFCLLFASLFAQNQNNNWYFGNRAALSFSNGNPVPISTSQMVSIEGCASVSDPVTGNLLFYTNGVQIWNAANNVMPNGNGLLSGGSTSATQGVLIVPYPGNANLYYVFTVDETSNNGAKGFRYTIVDMNLDNGLGDVPSQQKNVLIQTNTTERIAVTNNADDTGYWILIHERDNNCFKAYSVIASGINTTPVVSNVGSIHSTTPQVNGDGTMGYMQFSHDGNKIAVALYASNKIELFDFDNCLGTLSNPQSFTTIDNPYGIEFSPDNSKLYYSLFFNAGLNGAIYQLNLSLVNPTPQLVGISSSLNIQCVGALQLAPDNKIYVAINSETWLSSISQPDSAGGACGFMDKAILLPAIGLFPTTGILGLPPKVVNLVTNPLPFPAISASNFCFNDSTRFEVTGVPNIDRVFWDFGFSNFSDDSSSLLKPSVVLPDTGTFLISALVETNCRVDTVTVEVQILVCDTSCKIAIPNAFTPNNDGINDRFSVLTTCNLTDFECRVYDRWGGLVWTSINENDHWDGKCNGIACAPGVYLYYLQTGTPSGSKKISGSITLIR